MKTKKTPPTRSAKSKSSTPVSKRATARARKAVRKGRTRLEWWPDPDPMSAILKALGSRALRQEFLNHLDDYRDELVAWLDDNQEGEGLPFPARQLIEEHLERTDGEFFDEIVVGSDSSDIGMGYSVTLYARRRGKLIYYRSRDDNGGEQEYAPTKEPLEDDEIADLIGPETLCYDYESEAEDVAAELPEDPSDEQIDEAARGYAEHVTSTKVEAVSERVREQIKSKRKQK